MSHYKLRLSGLISDELYITLSDNSVTVLVFLFFQVLCRKFEVDQLSSMKVKFDLEHQTILKLNENFGIKRPL